MGPDDVPLKALGLLGIDPNAGEVADARRNAVHGLFGGDHFLDDPARGFHPILQPRCDVDFLAVNGDGYDVLKREVLADQNCHTGTLVAGRFGNPSIL